MSDTMSDATAAKHGADWACEDVTILGALRPDYSQESLLSMLEEMRGEDEIVTGWAQEACVRRYRQVRNRLRALMARCDEAEAVAMAVR